MATLAAAVARRTAAVARSSSPHISAPKFNLIQRRGFAGAADHHGPPKINCWQDPMSPLQWKEEHFVIVSFTGWGLFIYGTYKFFTGGKGKKEEVGHISNGAPLVHALDQVSSSSIGYLDPPWMK